MSLVNLAIENSDKSYYHPGQSGDVFLGNKRGPKIASFGTIHPLILKKMDIQKSNIFGSNKVMVNSLHGQGIKEPGVRVIIDGYANDGTPEALSIKDSIGFCLAVQWHPEWNASCDNVSKPLFQNFGKNLRLPSN